MFPLELHDWARRHNVSPAAFAELAGLLGCNVSATVGDGSESRVQSRVRLEAPARGFRLFRNNVGVLRNEDGRPVRYGLANDSPAVNKRLKSSDLIGWRRVAVGDQVVAQFVALECKPADWRYRGDEHEEAQHRWLSLVAADGGYAKFITDPGQL